MGLFKFIWKNLDNYKLPFILLFIVGVLDGIFSFMIPVTLTKFTEDGLQINALGSLIFWIITFYVGSLIFQYIIRRWGESLGPKFGNHLREKFFLKFQSLPLQKIQAHHSAYRTSLLNSVCGRVSSLLHVVFWTIAESLATFTLFFYFTAKESLLLAVLNLVVLTFFVLISSKFSYKAAKISDELNRNTSSFLSKFLDFMSNLVTVKKLGIRKFSSSTIHKAISSNQEKIQELQTFHAKRWFILHSLFGISFLSTIIVLAFKIANGEVSAAILILFVSAYSIIRSEINRLSEFIKSLMEISKYIDSLEEVARGESNKGKNFKWNSLTCKDIYFNYSNKKEPIRIPYLKINKKDKICIAGKSGSGKTTIGNIISGLLQFQKGELLVDKKTKIIPESFTEKNIAIISQDSELFNLSLRENLTLGKKISDKRIKHLMKELDLDSLLEKKNGLNKKLREKGSAVSSGEKQRINILRGILQDKQIYIFDEPTSNLDDKTEKKVCNFLRKHLKNKTVVIITHRKSLRGLCSKFYKVEKGMIAPLTK